MKLQALTKVLEANPDAELHILLPTGEPIPEHFHVTEVGRVQNDFIDCGGTVRQRVFCLLQAWVANDVEHRITASKLLQILKKAESVLGVEDLPLEFEYGEHTAAQYMLACVHVRDISDGVTGLLFELKSKQTDCLAPDKCGVLNICCSDDGCCESC